MAFILRCDARVHVLMITFGKVVTDDVFLAGLAAARDFASQHGPHHGITDFSRVESFDVTNELLSELGSMAPVFPPPMRRLVVASTPAALVCTRIVQTLRSGSSATIEVVATVDKAYAMLGTNCSDLIDTQAQMTNYTFYVLEPDGYLVGGTTVSCSDDDEALARAKELLGVFNAAVEVWDGSRKVWNIGSASNFSDAAHLNGN